MHSGKLAWGDLNTAILDTWGKVFVPFIKIHPMVTIVNDIQINRY